MLNRFVYLRDLYQLLASIVPLTLLIIKLWLKFFHYYLVIVAYCCSLIIQFNYLGIGRATKRFQAVEKTTIAAVERLANDPTWHLSSQRLICWLVFLPHYYFYSFDCIMYLNIITDTLTST